MKVVLIILLLSVAGIMLYVRLAPSDPDRWHVEPADAPDPERRGVKRVFELEGTPSDVLTAFDAVAVGHPRVSRLAGDFETGHITYIARSRIWGFPDYVTVKAESTSGGETTTFYVLSRLRFGGSDTGVNQARMTKWMADVGSRLGS